jgi:hypothetical protein
MRRTLSPRMAYRAGGFALLLVVTLLGACLTLAGWDGLARHPGPCAVALAVGWGLYYAYSAAAAISFLHLVLWLVWTHP